MTRDHLMEIEPNQTNANSALKVLYIELLGLPSWTHPEPFAAEEIRPNGEFSSGFFFTLPSSTQMRLKTVLGSTST
jgi:hypothetical protein